MIPSEMPWYRSRIIIGAIVSILTKVLVFTGLADGVIDDEATTNAVMLAVGGLADLYVVYQRATQKAAPTITR